MTIGLIGKKIGMTREFFNSGVSIPVTVLFVEKGRIMDVITKEKRGYDAIKVGFGKIKKDDENPSFKDNIFSVDKEKVLRNIKKCSKGQKSKIIEGFYKDTIENKTTQDLKISKSRVVLIDCDLKESTRLALEFIRPSIQEGTIILFDDYVFFKGNVDKGEYGAFNEFQKKYPEILFRRIFDYGYGSRAFIAYKIN